MKKEVGGSVTIKEIIRKELLDEHKLISDFVTNKNGLDYEFQKHSGYVNKELAKFSGRLKKIEDVLKVEEYEYDYEPRLVKKI